ncbi:hypothetical protein GpartN1_g38.t1 [Galdieria partita]|uniref:Dimethylargininase n=1 Tax=Galdieria partita TaxID=83374 RepID=A0A9C7PR65_9RHOD|nr:hypothetical protein GpartN1_g38.t1 [Galdieria partita]
MRYSCAIVRHVADTFDCCIKDPKYGEQTILVSEARRQHEEYCELLSSKVSQVVEIAADNDLPDCVFVEDTAVVVGNIAIITHPAPISRRQEVWEVEKVFRNQGLQVLFVKDYSSNQVFLDGGDVLWTGRHLFVGVGERTNWEAIEALRKCLESVEVVPIKLEQIMHLKSVVTFIPCPTVGEDFYGFLVVAETLQGRRVFQAVSSVSSGYEVIWIPEEEAYAANVLYCNGTVMIPKEFPESAKRMASRLGSFYSLAFVNMSQFRIANGALTCCSILF